AVVRPLAVRAPVALVRAGGRVEHDHAAIAVTVRDIDLPRGGVDVHVGRPAEPLDVVAAAGLAWHADRQQALAAARELDHEVIARGAFAVTGDPDVVLRVDEDAVLRARPRLLGLDPRGGRLIPPGAAPALHEAAVAIELDHGRCGRTAIGGRRVLHRARLVLGQRARTLHDPNVVVAADRNARDLAQDPVLRQRRGPCRIDAIGRHAVGLRPGVSRAEQRAGDHTGRQDGGGRAARDTLSQTVTPLPGPPSAAGAPRWSFFEPAHGNGISCATKQRSGGLTAEETQHVPRDLPLRALEMEVMAARQVDDLAIPEPRREPPETPRVRERAPL